VRSAMVARCPMRTLYLPGHRFASWFARSTDETGPVTVVREDLTGT
jgi:hypothetical protein